MSTPTKTLWLPFDEYLTTRPAAPDVRVMYEMDILSDTFRRAVVRYRTQHGLSQSALGRRICMAQRRIARIEDGRNDPSFATMRHICNELDLEMRIEIRPSGRDLPATPKARGGFAEVSDQATVVIKPARRPLRTGGGDQA